MAPTQIAIVSSPSLEKWDWRAPARGIGGSETSHVKMAQGLKAAGFDIVSFAPVPEAAVADPSGLPWRDTSEFRAADFKVVIDYRDPALLRTEKPSGAKWWFVAQDVGYPWGAEIDTVDRYLALCPVHAKYTRDQFPELHKSGRLFISSNGIDSEGIRKTLEEFRQTGGKRNSKRLMYASSPDRGLMCLLEQWFRILERVSDAELHVFYGFHNMEKIVAMCGPGDWRADYQRKLEILLKQPGVVWHDRVGQKELWRNWAESNIWPYFCDFPETNCITSMEAQACGAIPVTTNFWALRHTVAYGYKFDGLPQKSAVVRQLMVEKVVELLRNSDETWDKWPGGDLPQRNWMMVDADKRFDWSNVVGQWSRWLEEDLKK